MRRLLVASWSVIALIAALASPAYATTASLRTAAASKAATPERILSLSASATQMLYTVGAGRQVVGVDKYSMWPADAPRTKFTGYETDAEDYLKLHPDFVVFGSANPKLEGQLRALGIRTLVQGPATTIAGIYAQMEYLGAITGHAQQAAHAVAAMRRAITQEVAAAKNAGKGKSYYIELDPTYYSATSQTFIGAEFSLFGMRDIADGAAHGTDYPQITKEYLLKANPDYVFLADTVCCQATATSFGHRAGLAILKAVRDHHVIPVNDSVASEWGPHTVEQFIALIAGVVKR
ncbi:MAG TPA: ABC transporter substrate-binding protein [Acidimicrobiales bacterium]|nr:ABC transporter substrate-binding protein [Acidimicrobiales bacterium]